MKSKEWVKTMTPVVVFNKHSNEVDTDRWFVINDKYLDYMGRSVRNPEKKLRDDFNKLKPSDRDLFLIENWAKDGTIILKNTLARKYYEVQS